MTPTEKLRVMLDKRGVEWTNPNSCLRDEMTSWVANGFDYDAFEVPDGTLLLTAAHQDDLTPEQAIAATLGAGTCHEVMIDKFFRGCSECGYMWEYMYGIGNRSGPNFCPKCGARVVRA